MWISTSSLFTRSKERDIWVTMLCWSSSRMDALLSLLNASPLNTTVRTYSHSHPYLHPWHSCSLSHLKKSMWLCKSSRIPPRELRCTRWQWPAERECPSMDLASPTLLCSPWIMCSVISSSRKVHHSTPHHTTTQHITHNLSSLSDQWVEVVYEVSWIRQEDSQIAIILAGEVRREVLAQGIKEKKTTTHESGNLLMTLCRPKELFSLSLSLFSVSIYLFISILFCLVYYVISIDKEINIFPVHSKSLQYDSVYLSWYNRCPSPPCSKTLAWEYSLNSFTVLATWCQD